MALQEQLVFAGLFQGEPNGWYGPQKEEAVKALQARFGSVADGKVGPETRLLFMRAVEENIPRLRVSPDEK